MFSFFKQRNFLYPFVIWLILVLWYSIVAYNFFDLIRLKTQDLLTNQAFYLFFNPPQQTKEIIVVAVDETSRRRLNMKWPWDRNITAKLIRNIAFLSPKVIGLDIIFSGKSDPIYDQELIAALKSHPKITVGYKLHEDIDNELPMPEILTAVKSIGYVTKPLEKDGIVRNLRIFDTDTANPYPLSLEGQILKQYFNISEENIKEDSRKGLTLGGKLFIPAKHGLTPINYIAHHNVFTTIPAYLVLENKIDADIFKDKIVLVGATDPIIHDQHHTPIGIISGTAIVANSLTMLLSQRFIYSLPFNQFIFITSILGLIILILNSRLKLATGAVFSSLIFIIAFAFSLFLRSKDIQFDYWTVFLIFSLSYIIPNFYKYAYLIYTSNRLKNLAIIDPATNFYTSRYLVVKLNHELKANPENIIFMPILIANYKKLSLELNYEVLQSLISLLAKYIQSKFGIQFKVKIFSRIAQDVFAVAVIGGKKMKEETLNETFKNFIALLKKVEFKIEEKTEKIIPKAAVLYCRGRKNVSSSEILEAANKAVRTMRQPAPPEFSFQQLKETITENKKTSEQEDIFDFLVTDLEERNKLLEKTLQELIESKKDNETAYFETIRSLIKALEEKDTFTQGHSERVANYAKALANQLQLPQEQCDTIYKAALLHDIGKIGITEQILHKKEKLTEEDFNFIKKHVIMSVEILKPIKAFANLIPIILHHHEKFDGTGYPHGLSGKFIPIEAQILAVADTFDAITSGRGYKKGKSIQDAVNELEKCGENQLNSLYVEAFKKALSSGSIKFE